MLIEGIQEITARLESQASKRVCDVDNLRCGDGGDVVCAEVGNPLKDLWRVVA